MHAAVDEPRDAKVHLLMSLGMFATGEYRGAAMEAHAAAALGKVPDWPALFEIYGDADIYTKQLRALEKFVSEKPSSAEGRFLLGFQYLMEGHRDAAQNELLLGLKVAPRDRIAAQLLKDAGGTVPEDIAKQLSQLPPPPTQTPAEPPKLPTPPPPANP
jgi:thioredoxin-like negative regulator of GroEL